MCMKTAWKKFKELLPVLSSHHLSYKTCDLCVQLMCPECDASCKQDFALDKGQIYSNDRAKIRQICNVKPEDVAAVRSNELLARLEIDDLDVILREIRL